MFVATPSFRKSRCDRELSALCHAESTVATLSFRETPLRRTPSRATNQLRKNRVSVASLASRPSS